MTAGGPLRAPLRYPRLTLTLLLWLLGLYLAFLARPAAITREQELAFKAKIKEVRPGRQPVATGTDGSPQCSWCIGCATLAACALAFRSITAL